MKKILLSAVVILMAMQIKAQEKPTLYLLFEFMHVKGENAQNYWQVEDWWSGIHKQRVADKSILGWDLWSITPNGSEQGSQYMTVTLFSSLKDMLQTATSWDAYAYAKKAYPKMSEKELNAMFDKTVKSRDLAHQVFCEQVGMTNGKFEMKVGTVATLDIMKQLDDSYEKAETEIFKPWHQKMVDAGKKGSWELLRTILPAGSEAYGTHMTVSMYSDAAQLATFMENSDYTPDFITELGVKEGLKTREWKEMKIGKLEKMVR